MRNTSQEDNLSVKVAFEIWDTTFGVKFKRYHTDNGIFSKQPFRSAIEDTNHTITFCEVGSHHKNAIVERITQTLKLGAITLIIHAKIYWPETITTMLCPHEMKDFA